MTPDPQNQTGHDQPTDTSSSTHAEFAPRQCGKTKKFIDHLRDAVKQEHKDELTRKQLLNAASAKLIGIDHKPTPGYNCAGTNHWHCHSTSPRLDTHGSIRVQIDGKLHTYRPTSNWWQSHRGKRVRLYYQPCDLSHVQIVAKNHMHLGIFELTHIDGKPVKTERQLQLDNLIHREQPNPAGAHVWLDRTIGVDSTPAHRDRGAKDNSDTTPQSADQAKAAWGTGTFRPIPVPPPTKKERIQTPHAQHVEALDSCHPTPLPEVDAGCYSLVNGGTVTQSLPIVTASEKVQPCSVSAFQPCAVGPAVFELPVEQQAGAIFGCAFSVMLLPGQAGQEVEPSMSPCEMGV